MIPYPVGGPVIVTLPATIDVTNARQIRDRMAAAIASAAPLIIADLSATVFCDAVGADWLHMIGYHSDVFLIPGIRRGDRGRGDEAWLAC